MYIRRKAFSVAIDENGEEKLFSTTEIIDEESYLEKLYAEAEEKTDTGKKAKTVGKAIAGAGAATYAGANVVGTKVAMKRKKAIEKIAEKTGTINVGGNGITAPAKYIKIGEKTGTINIGGDGITAPAKYIKFGEGAQEAANKAAKLDERHAKKTAKVLKRAGKVGAVGAGLAAAGTGVYLYGRHKSKKAEK